MLLLLPAFRSPSTRMLFIFILQQAKRKTACPLEGINMPLPFTHSLLAVSLFIGFNFVTFDDHPPRSSQIEPAPIKLTHKLLRLNSILVRVFMDF
jgi:hypothetical protein